MYGDAAFDEIVTIFGAMFARRPELVAAELVPIWNVLKIARKHIAKLHIKVNILLIPALFGLLDAIVLLIELAKQKIRVENF